MRPLLAAFAVVVVTLCGALPAAADDWPACDKASGDASIAACGRLISTGKAKGKDLASAYYNRGYAYEGQHNYDAALDDFGAALRIDSKSKDAADYFYERGYIYNKKKDFEKSIADYTDALRLSPKTLNTYAARGDSHSEKGDYDLAISDFTEALKIDPKSLWAFESRSEAWTGKGDYDRAIADTNAALKISPKDWVAFRNRCDAMTRKGDLAHALADCNLALQYAKLESFDSKSESECHCRAVMSYDRGRVFELQGNFASALADYKAALELDPKDIFTGEAISRMEKKLVSLAAPKPATSPPATRLPEPASPPTATTVPPPAALPAAPAAKPAPATAEPPVKQAAAPAESRIALVIGNSNYASVGLLPNPKNDAEAMAATLRRIGFTKVTLLLDQSREQLMTALGGFARDAERADWAVVYYAGHGIELGGINFIVPVDAKLTSDRDVSFQAVKLDDVLAAVSASKRLHVVILDACRDNPFTKTMTRSMTSTRSIGQGLGPIELDVKASVVVYAAKQGQVALDGATGNSPFVTAMVKNLERPGVEIGLLFRRVRDDVLQLTDQRQEPFVYQSLPSEEFYFRVPAP